MPALLRPPGSHALDWLTSNFRSFRTGFCTLDEVPDAVPEALQGFPWVTLLPITSATLKHLPG